MYMTFTSPERFWGTSEVFLGFSFWWALPPDPRAEALPPVTRLRVHTFGGAPFHQFLDQPLVGEAYGPLTLKFLVGFAKIFYATYFEGAM